MLKDTLKYPITHLIAIIVLYSVYDYWEHILREGSVFEEHPWQWLLFCTSALTSLILIVILVKIGLQRIFKQKNLLLEVAATGVWLALYLSFLGPLLDHLFWPYDELHFRFNLGPFFILLIGYFALRILINLVMRKKALYSK